MAVVIVITTNVVGFRKVCSFSSFHSAPPNPNFGLARLGRATRRTVDRDRLLTHRSLSLPAGGLSLLTYLTSDCLASVIIPSYP